MYTRFIFSAVVYCEVLCDFCSMVVLYTVNHHREQTLNMLYTAMIESYNHRSTWKFPDNCTSIFIIIRIIIILYSTLMSGFTLLWFHNTSSLSLLGQDFWLCTFCRCGLKESMFSTLRSVRERKRERNDYFIPLGLAT